MDNERDYIQEIELAYIEFLQRGSDLKSMEFKIIIVPINLYFGLERQMILNNSFMFDLVNKGIRLFGRRVISSQQTDKIEFY